MRKKFYSASDIEKFCYCPEQYRLSELEKQGKIVVSDAENIFIETRFEEGKEYHQQYAQRYYSRPKTSDCSILVGCLVLFLLSPLFIYILSKIIG